MPISIEHPNSQRVAETSHIGVTGLPGAGVHVMVCHLKMQTYQRSETILIRNPAIRVEMGKAGGLFLGTAAEDHRSFIEINRGTSGVQMAFRVPLGIRQIESIERKRNGGSLRLSIWFTAEVASQDGIRSTRDQADVTISQSAWVQFLEDSGYKRILLYEIERPLADGRGNNEAIDLLDTAHMELLEGRYDECVQKCRQVIEVLEQTVPRWKGGKRASEAFTRDRESMDKDERITFMLMAVRHATHPAHHGSRAGFSRPQAKAILGSLTAIMSEAG